VRLGASATRVWTEVRDEKPRARVCPKSRAVRAQGALYSRTFTHALSKSREEAEVPVSTEGAEPIYSRISLADEDTTWLTVSQRRFPCVSSEAKYPVSGPSSPPLRLTFVGSEVLPWNTNTGELRPAP
jgi:hypothetical protein